MIKKKEILLAFLGALTIFPAILLGIVILKYSVNVIFWDQFGTAPYIYRYFAYSHLNFGELIAQHNESRLLFPRLISIGLASLTGWNVRYEMVVTFFLACIISLNIYLLNSLVLGKGIWKTLLVTAISNLLIFSPVQYENWLWGFQFIAFIPMFSITSCFLLIYSKFNAIAKIIGCIFLSTFSTFSFTNGMLCWVIVAPVLAFKTWQQLFKNPGLIKIWIAGFLFNIGIYFWNYRANSKSFSSILNQPLAVLEYFFSFLGASFCAGNQGIAKFIGALLVIVFMGVCTYLWRFRKDYILWDQTICWLMIGIYVISSALITTFGRVILGVGQAFSPRYTTVSLYLAIALIPLGVIIINDITQKRLFSAKKQNFLRSIILALCTYLLIMQIFSWINAINIMSVARIERLQGKSCLLFINVVEEKECLSRKIYPYFKSEIKSIITGLNDIGFIQPALIKTNVIQDIEIKEQVSIDSYGYGYFDQIIKEKDHIYKAWGWARLPARGEPADAVILTYEDPQKGDIVFAISALRTERPDVVKATGKNGYLMSGWQKSFATSKLPKSQLQIKAWAFDTNRGKAFRISGSHVLQK